MSDVWITDIRHYLGQDLSIIELTDSAARLRDFLGSIIGTVTLRNPEEIDYVTEIKCRRRPGHRRCEGNIVAYFGEEDPSAIKWYCTFCDDSGYIRGWQGTVWDKTKSR